MARALRVLIAAAVCASAAGSAAAEAPYLVKDLGTLGGTISGALSLNERREVVGHAFIAGNRAMHAFHDDGGGMRDLGTLGGPQAQARHINTRGEVVGWAFRSDGERHAALWRGGVPTDLGTLGGSVSDARWINAHGDVVGSSLAEGDRVERAFLWRDGTLHDLGTLGGTDARAYAINDLGEVVGFARIPGNAELHAFLWRMGAMTDLGTLGGWASHAYAINNYGKVCGWSMKVPNQVSHAFVWSEGVTLDLGTLGGVYSAAFSINDHGHVVGTSTNAAGQQRAFLWDGGEKIVDLNTRIPANSGWVLTSASAINDDGAIAGVGRYRFEDHAFLLLPVSSLAVDRGPVAAALAFSGPVPNPVREAARFDLTLTRPGRARVEVFDPSGRRVRVLADGAFPAGRARVTWDGRDETGAKAGAGVYFARLEAEERVLTVRFARVR
jgi:probable HAF family extracellular repeat protein